MMDDIDYEALSREIQEQIKFDYEYWWGGVNSPSEKEGTNERTGSNN